jgi:hypothetical protein
LDHECTNGVKYLPNDTFINIYKRERGTDSISQSAKEKDQYGKHDPWMRGEPIAYGMCVYGLLVSCAEAGDFSASGGWGWAGLGGRSAGGVGIKLEAMDDVTSYGG